MKKNFKFKHKKKKKQIKKIKKLTSLAIDYLINHNFFSPYLFDRIPHIDYLPKEINDYYFYSWYNSSLDQEVLSANTPKINALIFEVAKFLKINISKSLLNIIFQKILNIAEYMYIETYKHYAKIESKNNNLNYFKHWISRCLLQYWEIKNIFPHYTGKNHLIIYDKKTNNKFSEELNSKNNKLPFGDFNYNDEFLEKTIFANTESKMGELLRKLHKKQNSEFSDEDEYTIYYFWITLILRNKNTIINFSQSLKEEFIYLINNYSNFKEFSISYYRHYHTYGCDKYINEIKTFKSINELNLFIESDNFYFFAKHVYWKHIGPLFPAKLNIYDKKRQKGEFILKDILYFLSQNYITKRIPLNESIVNLGDYPCFSFQFSDDDIIPINFDASFFNDYIYECENHIDLRNFLDPELIEKMHTISNSSDEDKFIVKIHEINIQNIVNFDLLIIPINPSQIMISLNKNLNIDLKSKLLQFFKKYNLSTSMQRILSCENECVNVLYFHSIFTHIISKNYIIFPNESHIKHTQDLIINEKTFINNITNLIKRSYLSYHYKYNHYKDKDHTYIKSNLCDYRITI